MKKIVSLMAIALTLSAYDGTSKSLAGVELGYSQLKYSMDDSLQGSGNNDDSFGLVGLKIGAENEVARIFIDGHYYNAGGNFDYVNSIGVSLQYLLRATDRVNFFVGINGGLVNIKFSDDTIKRSYELSSAYYGGDLGMNIALDELLDWEFGVRLMTINASNNQVYTDTTNNNAERKYTMDHMLNFYTSLIFKFYAD